MFQTKTERIKHKYLLISKLLILLFKEIIKKENLK